MKTVFMKLLRLFGVDVLLLGLVEKIALGLIKKLTALQESARSALDRAIEFRNGKKVICEKSASA